MQKKAAAALTAAILLGLGSLSPTAEAGSRPDAEKALDQSLQAKGPETLAQKADRLARSTIKVSEIKVLDGSVLSEKELRRRLPELTRSETHIKKLSRQLALYNESGAIKIHVNFVPVGANYRAEIKAERGQGIRYGVEFQNSGSTYTGDWRAIGTYVNHDINGHGDTLGLALVGAPDNGGHVKEGALSYRVVLPALADTLTFSASGSDTDLDNLAKGLPFDITSTGKSTRYAFGYQHYFANSSREKDYLDVGFRYHHGWNQSLLSVGSTSVHFGHYDASHTDAYLNFNERKAGPGWRFAWQIGASGNLSGNSKDFHAMTPSSDRHYQIYQLHAGWLQSLGHRGKENPWLITTRLDSQYSPQKLIGCEKFGIGGRDSVRGFDENIRTGDNGISGSLELYTPQLSRRFRLLSFLDGASLRNHGGESTDLASTGLGFRCDVDNIHVALDYAYVFHEPKDVENDPAGHRRFNAWAGISF